MDTKDSLKSRMREIRTYGSVEGRRRQCQSSTQQVFAAMIEQQETLAKVTETQSHFVELPAPILEPAPVSKSTTQRNDIIASIRIGSASLDIYTGADAEVAVALCKVLSNAE